MGLIPFRLGLKPFEKDLGLKPFVTGFAMMLISRGKQVDPCVFIELESLLNSAMKRSDYPALVMLVAGGTHDAESCEFSVLS